LLLLKDRLAERLGAKPGTPPPGATAVPVLQVATPPSGELQIRADATVRPARTAAARATRAAPGTAAASAAAADAAAPPWSYSGATGPDHWGSLKPAYRLCATGQRQSPIDIRDGFPVELEPVQIAYRPSAFWVERSAVMLDVRVEGGNTLTLGGRTYALERISLRLPAEERVGGRSFDMGVQLHHVDPTGQRLVVGVLVERGEAQPWLQAVLNDLPLEAGTEKAGRAPLDPSLLLPEARGYFTYMGSLTTPPCTEGVQWVVFQRPVQASPSQIAMVARLVTANARPVQALAGRIVKQSN
jgi:carbonic anhydrase